MNNRDYTGDLIFNLLESLGKTQQELADSIGVTKSQVSEWSRGKTKSYYKYISEIADFLGVTVDYLLGKEQKNKTIADSNSLKPNEIEFLKKIRMLDEDGRKLAFAQLDAMVQFHSKNQDK